MAIVKCPNGHYYDNSKFDKCPSCMEDETLPMDDFRSEDFEKTVGLPVFDDVYEKTLGLDAVSTGFDDEKTIGFFSFEQGTELITGWIVCVKGPPRGKDYGLYHGKNRIGRGLDMDIYIPEDRAISRNEQATIVYEDKKSEFFIMSSRGSGTLLNGEPVDEVGKLKNGDRITMGESEFIFIAFCTEDRRWEEEV